MWWQHQQLKLHHHLIMSHVMTTELCAVRHESCQSVWCYQWRLSPEALGLGQTRQAPVSVITSDRARHKQGRGCTQYHPATAVSAVGCLQEGNSVHSNPLSPLQYWNALASGQSVYNYISNLYQIAKIAACYVWERNIFIYYICI